MKIRANIRTLSATSPHEKRAPAAGLATLKGSARRPISSTASPSGTLKANSHGHDATDRMPAATEGPATEAIATTIELIATPRPSRSDG